MSRVVLLALSGAVVFAQAPRAKDGKPDLSGVWGPAGYAVNIAKDLSGGAPMNAAGEKLYKERQASKGKGDPQATCLPSGVPRRDSRAFKIVQTPKLIVLLEEGDIHTYRQIFVDGSRHPGDLDPTWYGDSRAHWDGDELVVDTVGLNGRTWLDSAGHPASDKLHVTERFRRDASKLTVQITIEDPVYYTKPWTVTEVSPLLPKAEIREYTCHEDQIKAEYGK